MLEHSSTKKVRVLMRRDKTHKICANFLVPSDGKLEPHPSSERSWLLVVHDFADEEVKLETLLIRFQNIEIAQVTPSSDNSSFRVGGGKPGEDASAWPCCTGIQRQVSAGCRSE